MNSPRRASPRLSVLLLALSLLLAACGGPIARSDSCSELAEFVLEVDQGSLTEDEWIRLVEKIDELTVAAYQPLIDLGEDEAAALDDDELNELIDSEEALTCDLVGDFLLSFEQEVVDVSERLLREKLAGSVP